MNQISYKRNPNIDLVKLFGMLFIILGHLVNSLQTAGFKSTFYLQFFYSFVTIGVNLFFLSSGYMRIHTTLSKIIYFVLDVYIYSAFITFFGIITDNLEFDENVLKLLIFPLNNYWFFLVYLLLMIFSPILNIILDNLSKSMFIVYTIICVIVFGIWNLYIDAHIELCGGQHIFFAILMYLLGGGIRKYNFFNRTTFYYLCRFCIASILNFSLYYLSFKIFGRRDLADKLFYNNNFLVVFGSLNFFLFTLHFSINKKLNNIISLFGKNTFGVYMLHSSNWMATKYRNPILLNVASEIPLLLLPIFIIFYGLFVYIICLLINALKEKSTTSFIKKITEKTSCIILNLLSKMKEKVTI